MPKKENVLIIGASDNPERYSYKALDMLLKYGHTPYAIGVKEMNVLNIPVKKGHPDMDAKIDTVTLYVNPGIQTNYYDYILKLKPKRVIFNPGTENPEFEEILRQNEISSENACTLVLLGTGQF
jgi:predicted CoA-binding protein